MMHGQKNIKLYFIFFCYRIETDLDVTWSWEGTVIS